MSTLNVNSLQTAGGISPVLVADIAKKSELAADSGSALVNYLPAGTGAVAGTVQNALRSLEAPWTIEPIQLVVGNDPSYVGTYDFSELKTAIAYCTGKGIASGKMSSTGASSSARYQINIPAGTHTFTAMSFRGADLSGIQVWGSGKATTIIKCKLPDNSFQNGTWLNAVWTTFSDWIGFTLIPGDECTVITNPAVVCQEWHSGPTPWSPALPLVFMSFGSCTVGRLSGIHFNGNTTGCRLGTAINATGSTLGNIDDITFSNIQNAIFCYDGSTIAGLYSGLTATGVYQFLTCHLSRFSARKVVVNGILNGAVPYAGSHFADSTQSDISIQNGASGDNSISGFDRLVFLNGGRYYDETKQANRSNINDLLYRYPVAPGLYSANIVSIDAAFLPDADVLSGDVIIYNNYAGIGLGFIAYTGDNTGPRTLATPLNAKKVTVRNLTSNVSVSCIRGQLVEVSGSTAVWMSSSDGITRVYQGMNATGILYELIWEC